MPTTIFDLTPEERAKFRAFLQHEGQAATKMAEQAEKLEFGGAAMGVMLKKMRMDAAACLIVEQMLGGHAETWQ